MTNIKRKVIIFTLVVILAIMAGLSLFFILHKNEDNVSENVFRNRYLNWLL